VRPDDESRAGGVAVRLLPPRESADAPLVSRLANLVNRVYVVAEEGLWIDGATRTTVPEMRDLVGEGEIVVATIGPRRRGLRSGPGARRRPRGVRDARGGARRARPWHRP
jgi:hypothetical protein